MTPNNPNLAAFAGVHAALEAYAKTMPVVDPAIFRTQEMIGAQIRDAFESVGKPMNVQAHFQAILEPFVKSINFQVQAALGVQDLQRQIARAIAPALEAYRHATVPALTSIAEAVSEMNLASQLPDLSVLAHVGELVASGAFAPEFVEAAHQAVDAVPGYREEIQSFSFRETVAGVLDAKTIAEGTYIFVFLIWLVGSLYVSGLTEEAKTISDAIGLTGVAGAHSVAKYVSSKSTKVVIKKRNTRRR